MRKDVSAALQGIGVGLLVAIIFGSVASLVVAVTDWPGEAAEASERARILANAIAAGMYWAMLATMATVPASVFVLVRRARARAR